jgi:hypothetical protein
MTRVSTAWILLLLISILGIEASTGWDYEPTTSASYIQIKRAGNLVYFFKDVPSRVERYDIANGVWLAPINLDVVPTAAHVDTDGLYIASGPSLYRYNLDGTGKAHLHNATSAVYGILTSEDFIFGISTGGYYLYARVTTFKKTDNSYVQAYDGGYHLEGASISRSTKAIFGRSTGISPSDIQKYSYNAAGNFTGRIESPYHGDYPTANTTWVMPDDQRVVDNTGIIYSANDLTYLGSLGGSIDRITFNGNAPVIVRGLELIGFSASLLPSGYFTLKATPTHIEAEGSNLVLFFPDAASTSGLRAVAGPLSALNAPLPGTVVDPRQARFVPDDIFQDKNGNLLLLSKAHMSLFVWDPQSQTFTSSIPLTGAPSLAAYSSTDHRIYTAYNGGLIKMLDLDDASPAEMPFYTLPLTATGLACAGPILFATDASGAWHTHYTISNTGSLLNSQDWNYFSSGFSWSKELNRMYFLRDGVSPNDILYEPIDPVTGVLGNKVDSPEHTSTGKAHPIRLSPGSQYIILGSGWLYNPVNLVQSGSLANAITDVAWTGTDPVSIRAAGTDTQFQKWVAPTWYAGLTRTLPGAPLRIFGLADGSLVSATTIGGTTVHLNRVSASLGLMEPTTLLAPESPALTMTGERDLRINWFDVNEHAYEVEHRLNGGAWQVVANLPINSTSYAETGLAHGLHDYRIVSTAGTQRTASALLSLEITSPPNAPTGVGAVALATPTPRVNLSWSPLTGAANISIERKIHGTPSWTVLGQVAGNATTYSDTQVFIGILYEYRLIALNSAGSSPYSGVVTAEVPFDSVPGAPTLYLAGAGLLSWDSVPKTTRYSIYTRQAGSSDWVELISVGASTTTFDMSTASVLLPATVYDIFVQARNSLGSGPESNSITITTPSVILRDSFNPLNSSLWSSISGGQSISVSGGYDGNLLYFSGHQTRSAATVAFDGTYATIVSCKARLGSGSSPWENADPGENVILEGSTNGGGSWTQIAIVLDNAENPEGWQDFQAALPGNMRRPGLRLRWRQLAHSGNGVDVWGIDEVSITLETPANPPPVPYWFLTASTGQTEISLLWIDIAGESSYEVQFSNGPHGPWNPLATLPFDSTYYVQTNLQKAARYYYRIRAHNPAGASAWSPIASGRTWTLKDQWRYDHWGSAELSEHTSDSAQPAGDGVTNLEKYAFNLNPTTFDKRVLPAVDGTSGLPRGELIQVTEEPAGTLGFAAASSSSGDSGVGMLMFEYIRRKSSVDNSVTYIVEFADSPTFASAISNGEEIAVEEIDSLWERVLCVDTFDTTTAPKRFGRIRLVNNEIDP